MAQTGARGDMDIQDQRDTFHGFLVATVWSSIHIVQWVALLTLAFAIGAGWWPGLAAYVAIGVVAGLVFRMSAVYWAAQIVQWVLLGLGGMIVPALAGMTG
ncbi:MAG: aa3-type cytochrome c oxidase subunit IV [Hyphomonadaceae bacterium]|nr:aa3-type cytochrome c oxidase subunit IV [Hyphomonadaceae bacterium]